MNYYIVLQKVKIATKRKVEQEGNKNEICNK